MTFATAASLALSLRILRGYGRASVLIACLILAAIDVPRTATAQAPLQFDVASLSRNADLQPFVSVHEDLEGRMTLDQIRADEPAQALRSSSKELSFGFTRSPVWLTFGARNSSAVVQDVLLVLSYPHIDHVTLYIVHDDGRQERRITGDAVPFAQREARVPQFVFRLSFKPHSSSSYHLRLQTSGVLKTPLAVWRPEAFFKEQHRLNTVSWMFYGLMLVLILYNFGVYVTIRQREYLAYSIMQAALVATVATLHGHAFQYVLPSAPEAANRALPACLAVVIGAVTRFASWSLESTPEFSFITRRLAFWTAAANVLIAFSCLAEAGLGLRVMLVVAGIGLTHIVVNLGQLARARDPVIRIYVASWIPLTMALPAQLLPLLNLTPSALITDFAALAAIAAHGIITSLALAARVNTMNTGLADLNSQLSMNVDELQTALQQAEDAREEARRATVAKDEFMATMSHELRTPLNTIINMPQGLLNEFVSLRAARCTVCKSQFLLDPDEHLNNRTACPDCETAGSLRAEVHASYQGQPEQTTSHLRRIERSGRNMLHLINSILDFSKIDAGHLLLSPEQVDLAALLREAIDEARNVADSQERRIDIVFPEKTFPTVVDASRVKQIVVNVVANAFKFSEPQGTITLRWQATPDADVVAVQDQGIGIAPEELERIFQSFEQVHRGNTRTYGGTGLGLPIARALARMHAGDLQVESTPGKGSTFTLILPRPGRRGSFLSNDAAE